MRIGVDATIWPNRRGFGRYSRNVVSRLVELDRGSEYTLVVDADPPDDLPLPSRARVMRVGARKPHSSLYTSGRRRPLVDLARLSAAATRRRFDAFLFPCVDSWYPVVRTPTVVGLYDAISDEYPGAMFPSRRAYRLWRLKQDLAVRQARRLFTISDASALMLSEKLAVGDLPVFRAAPDAVFRPRGAAEIEKELGRLGLEPGQEFALYAAGIGPHKGLELLLDAWAEAGDGDELPPLVLVGDFLRAEYAPAVHDVRPRAQHLALSHDVRFTGFVSDDALACLYSAAAVVVVPSLAEGFGLPAVEAAACGAAIVASDIEAHREALGDSALYFAPGDAGDLAATLRLALEDPQLRMRLCDSGREAAARLSWDDSAEQLCALVHSAARR